MKVEDLLGLYGTQLSIVEHRYGNGFVVALEQVEGESNLDSVNDMNGECQWEMFGLWDDSSWYPIASGRTVVEAIAALNKKIENWTDADISLVGHGLSLIEQSRLKPAYFRVCKAKTLEQLREFFDRWERDEVSCTEMFETLPH